MRLLFVVVVENIAALRAELRRMVRIWRLPATLIALEQRCSLRLLAATFSAELAFVYSAAAAGPAILCRFVFRLLAAAVSTELTGIGSAAATGPAALCRFRLRLLAAAVSAELAGVGSTTAAGPGICCRCCCRRGGRGGRRRSRRLRLLRIRRLSVRRLLAVRILLSIHLLLLSLGKQASHICATGHSGHIHANKTAHCTHAAFIASCNTHSVCSSTSHSCCCTVRIAEHLDIFQTLSIFRAAAEPAIAGGLGIEKGYAADAWKTADLISNVGSTAAILYMRDYVTNPDNTRETIVTNYYPCPVFSGGKVTLLQRGVGLFAIKSTDERKNLGAVVFAKWLAQENSNLNFAMQAGYLPTNKEALPKLLNNPQDVHNFKYRKLYTCMQQVYKQGTWLHLPHNAAEIQQNLEYGSKNILRAAHQQYLQEIAGGANPQQTLDKLVEESYQKLLNYKQ